MDTKITSNDLNAIDALNGSSSVSGKKPIYAHNDILKGALNPDMYGGWDTTYRNELLFIESEIQKLYEYQTERFEYENLPEGLNKYRLEDKTVWNGSCVLIKGATQYFAMRYTIKKFDIYEEPVEIIINEPKSFLNGKTYYEGEFAIFDNNRKRVPVFFKAYRFISAMEKTLFQIEKNLTSSAPKGIISLGNSEWEEPNNSPLKTSLERMVNGQDTFSTLKGSTKTNVMDNGRNELFTPIELSDRTDNLWKNYNTLKNELKELVGAYTNNLSNKKERLVTSEIETQQPISNAIRQHSYNVRKLCIENINKLYGLNIIIKYLEDERNDNVDDEKEVENEL